MKYLPMFVLLMCLQFAACKKNTEPSPVPAAPTNDFRSNIAGEYRLTYKSIYILHPDMKPKDTTITNFTDDVTISYSIKDVTTIRSYSYRDTVLPAITFTWHGSGQTETYGMLDSTHLCGNGRYSEGWFINKDSISYFKSDAGVSFDWRAYINGRRK